MPRQPDQLPDWFVGGAGKRRLLQTLVNRAAGDPPWNEVPPWSKAALAHAAGLHEKHTVFRHLEILALAGLLEEEGSSYRLNEDSGLIGPLRDFTAALDLLDPRPLPPSRGNR